MPYFSQVQTIEGLDRFIHDEYRGEHYPPFGDVQAVQFSMGLLSQNWLKDRILQ